MSVDLSAFTEALRELARDHHDDGARVRLLLQSGHRIKKTSGSYRVPTVDIQPPPMAMHADVLRAMRERNAAIESWLAEVLGAHGVTLAEAPSRCLLVTKDGPRLLGQPWVDEMHVEIDGARVGPGLRLTTEIITEAP